MAATIHAMPDTGKFTQFEDKVFEPIEHADFCAVLETGDYLHMTDMAGIIMLHLPRGVLFCNGDQCMVVRHKDANIQAICDNAVAYLAEGFVAEIEAPIEPLPKAA